MHLERHRLGVALFLLVASALAAGPALADTLPNIIVNDRLADTTPSDTQSGTTLVLGPSSTILCSFNDSGSYTTGGTHFTGIARSTNSGVAWLDQGQLPASAGGDGGFPCFARSSATGTVILTTLDLNTGSRVNAFRSVDNGLSYATPTNASVGGSTVDRPWIACDNFTGTGSGNFYVAYREFGASPGMYATRSTDDGLTWSPRTLLVANTGEMAWVVVGADHAVYVFWLNTTGNQYVFRKSTDQGVTFGTATTVATLLTAGTNGDLGLGGGFRTPDNIQVVAQPNDANQLYAVWADKASSPDKANVYFSQTTNAGATWSTPTQVNTDAGPNDQWQPVIALTPDGTSLFVSWYDRRLDAANSLIDVFGRVASVSGSTVTFTPDFRITTTSFPVVVGQDPNINPNYMGDYDTAVADNTGFYRTWGDNRNPNADATHAHQPDVFFTKVPRGGPGVAILANGSSLTGENCAVNGAPDPNERVTYSLALTNQGSQPSTNLVATLQSGSGVTAPSSPQSYGAIAIGGSASRSFSFNTTGACGSTVTAVLDLQDGATHVGTVSFPFRLGTTSAPIGPVTYFTGNVFVPIPAVGTMGDMNDVLIGVSPADSGQVTDVNVLVRLNHTFDNDLTIQAVSPAGTTVTLCTAHGGSGDNFGAGSNDCNGTYTIFDDAAGTPISTGVAPFAASYRPDHPLSAFNGESPVGNWRLKIHDGVNGDSGTLFCWELQFTRTVSTCASCAATAVEGAPPPAAFAVWPNRPNPFTHSTEIRYALPQRAPVELAVYTIDGRRVATLVHEVQGPGEHVASFGTGLATAEGTRLGVLASGVYFYRLRAGSYTSARKMMLVR